MPPSWTLPQPARFAVAAVCALGAWWYQTRSVAPPPPVPRWLRCPELSERRVLHERHRLASPGPAPAEALPAEARIEGLLFLPDGCVDGWLTSAAARPPELVAMPAGGHTGVAVVLAGARPGDRVDLAVGSLPIARGLRVLSVDGHPTEDDGEGGTRTWPSPTPARVEVADADVGPLSACLTLGPAAAHTATAAAAPWVAPDCARLGQPEEGMVAAPIVLDTATPQTRVDLVADGRVLVEGALVLDVGGQRVPGLASPGVRAPGRVAVPPEVVAALARCSDRLSALPSRATSPRTVDPTACAPRRAASLHSQPEHF